MPLHLAGTPGVRRTLLQVMHDLRLSQAMVAQAIQVTEATPGTQTTLELDFHQLH